MIKRGSGERSVAVNIQTALAMYRETGRIMDCSITRTFALMNKESSEQGSEVIGLNTDTDRQQKTVFRIQLHGDSPPALIFVARKSNTGPPKDWLNEEEDLEVGLEMFGKTILDDYQKTFDDHRGAVLIAGLGVRTADIFPATSMIPQNNWDRTRLRYANQFSAAIEEELQHSDFDAKIVSIGIDAWGCDSDRIRDFLKRNIIH
ncbi:hypothetical protein E8E13_004918 [Curvularia kusanoi]|uniref:Uncharacterized protein n=1 Tax=Curvularia kusanoi TaxID=90978 RepID=A0A9P4THT9_CURKU|nr:hypothetical protein E8E13_004918 [Curvularia kusanoi]